MSEYTVKHLRQPFGLHADWNRAPWTDAPALTVGLHMGARPAHFPRTQARLLYDDQALFALFRVEDRYVRAVAQKHQDTVWTDSCVEFFFTPGTDVDQGYFNLEMNCGGTMLLNFQVVPRHNPVALTAAECAQVEIVHTLPRIVEPERPDPTTWSVACRLPLAILAPYRAVAKPGSGAVWRANFFKCGEHTSHPHYLTWTHVDRPQPDFHVPACFGRLVFE